jgi:uncharacterized protein YmfQ (DUF2313 family)
MYMPTQDQIAEMLFSLLPPGRAFQQYGSYVDRSDSVMKRLFYAIAETWYKMEVKLAQLMDEMSPGTAESTLDLWWEDYGLPDECDPFANDLAAKVSARGGTSAAYYQDIANSLGWTTTMRWLTGSDATYPGVRSTLYVGISLASPAITNFQAAQVGIAQVGVCRLGEPDTGQILCVLDRLMPAHAAIISEFIF